MARGHIAVTLEAVRAPRGIETPRQRSTRAIGRTTPCLLGLFRLVVLLAPVRHPAPWPTRRAAWDANAEATGASALAAVRAHRRARWNCAESAATTDLIHIPRPLWNRRTDLLAYAARLAKVEADDKANGRTITGPPVAAPRIVADQWTR